MTVSRGDCDFYQIIHRQIFSLRETGILNQLGIYLNVINYKSGYIKLLVCNML